MVSDHAPAPSLPADGNDGVRTTTNTARETTKMIGTIRTTTVSAWGLSIGYKLRSDCWGKGSAPRREVVVVPDVRASAAAGQRRQGDDGAHASAGDVNARLQAKRNEAIAATTRDAESDVDGGDQVEITHLIAQVDLENVGSMRVCEKCGGRLVAVEKECIKVWRFAEMRDMAVWRFDKPSGSLTSQA
ncbi:hypothetical protein COL516b_007755 [Colletotrichum fioriniae]|nr:uncharacterized protein COL516b_007755 [Colletotrichum fioriniae]KAJ0301355.1 hypothetical protein COL516b_007755 [Colletotrichum fioriniae]